MSKDDCWVPVLVSYVGVSAAKATIWFLAWRLEKGFKTFGCYPLRRLVRLKIAVFLASRNSFRTLVPPELTLSFLAPQPLITPSENSVWKSIREKNFSADRVERKIDFLHAHPEQIDASVISRTLGKSRDTIVGIPSHCLIHVTSFVCKNLNLFQGFSLKFLI
jgi:hypothetical protein